MTTRAMTAKHRGRGAIAKTFLPVFNSLKRAGQLQWAQGSQGTWSVPQPQRSARTTNHTASAKPHNQEPVAAPSTSVHPCPPCLEGLHILLECFSLSIISRKNSLCQQPCLYLELYFSLHLHHHHNSRPTPMGFLESQSPQQVRNSAHHLFLSMGTLSPLSQPSSRLEELGRGSSPAPLCFPCSRTS